MRQWEDPGFCEYWSESCGQDGDIFHREIVKPFLAICIDLVCSGHQRDGASSWLPLSHQVRMAHEEKMRDLANTDPGPAPPKDVETHLRRHLEKWPGLSVVDLGAGEAWLGRWLAEEGVTYVGVEPSFPLLEAARAKCLGQDRIHLHSADLLSCDRDKLSQLTREAIAKDCPGVVAPDLAIPNVVTLCCVLDAMKDEEAEAGLGVLRQWLVPPSHACLVVTTLNPFFFRTSLNMAEPRELNQPTEPVRITIGKENRSSDAYIRLVSKYERMFVRCGFHVLYQASPNLGRMTLAVRKVAAGMHLQDGRDRDDFSGPFVTWLLKPRQIGAPSSVADATADSDQVSRLFAHSERVEYKGSDMIEMGGALSGHLYRVENGSVLRLDAARYAASEQSGQARIDEALEQRFDADQIIGEFEAGPNLISDRYKDPLVAGSDGATLLEVPHDSLRSVLSDKTLVGNLMFNTLRDRMSRYAWTWLRESAVRGKTAPKLVKCNATDRNVELLARALLFGLTREADDRPCGQARVVLATLKDLARFVRLNTKDNIFRDELDLFIRAGLVDSCRWELPATANFDDVTPYQRDCLKQWKKMGERALEIFFAGLCPELRDRVAQALFGSNTDFWNTRKPFYYQNRKLTADASSVKDNAEKILLVGHHHELVDTVARWFENMGSVQRHITHSLAFNAVFVRDEAGLRDLVGMNQSLPYLADRSLGKPQARLEPCRWEEYNDALFDHVSSVWLRGGILQSTTEKLGFRLN